MATKRMFLYYILRVNYSHCHVQLRLTTLLAHQVLQLSLLMIVDVFRKKPFATKALLASAAYVGFGVTRCKTLVAASCAQHLLCAAIDMVYYIISRKVLRLLLLVATAALNRRGAPPTDL